jgi:transposase
MAPVTTRFRVPVARCRNCRRRVQGRHAEQSSDALGAAGAGVGPTAKAFAAWLHYGLGLSFGKSAALLRRLGIEVTAGAICQSSQATGTALVPVQAEIVAKVNAAPVVVPDETGWRVEAESAWLWTAATTEATAYWVADGRGFEQACEVIDPDYEGVLVREGWAPYRRFTEATHQTCYAHLLRRCRELLTDLPGFARGTADRWRRSSRRHSPRASSHPSAAPRSRRTSPSASSCSARDRRSTTSAASSSLTSTTSTRPSSPS